MTTVIKIEGDAPYSIPHVDHIAAIAHGENVDLTMYVALPGHTELEPIYVQLSVPAAHSLFGAAIPGHSREREAPFRRLVIATTRLRNPPDVTEGAECEDA